MLKKFNQYKAREDGFTLIELLVVVLIIGILAAIAVPIYLNVQNGAKKSSLASDVATTRLSVAAALTQEKTVNDGSDSATVGTTVSNSKVNDDEVVYVNIGADADGTKTFTVTAQSAKQDYAYQYDSTTKSSKPVAVDSSLGTGNPGAAANVPAGTVVYQSDFSASGTGGWAPSGLTDSVAQIDYQGGVLQINQSGYSDRGVSGATRTITGLVVGQSYTVTANIMNSYDIFGAQPKSVVTVDGVSGTPVTPKGFWLDATNTFTATSTSAVVSVESVPDSTFYDRGNLIKSVSVVAN